MRHLIVPILVLVGLTTLGELFFESKSATPTHKTADKSRDSSAPAAMAASPMK
jgi:hypothetical protein